VVCKLIRLLTFTLFHTLPPHSTSQADSDYAAEQGVWSVAEEEWKWAPLTTTTTITTTTTAVAGGMVNGLNHSSTYFLRVREAGGAGSDPVRFRTAAPGMMHGARMISEHAEGSQTMDSCRQP
jgi:hypothetical protein